MAVNARMALYNYSPMPHHLNTPDPAVPLAVLASGGLDSAILVAEACHRHPAVFPLYVRFGLAWEAVEQRILRAFLEAIACPVLRPLVVLEMPVRDLYGSHWSLTGHEVPDASSPDEAVFLPGRNVLFLAKAVLWCHLHGVPTLALAPLESNPFPDATPAFFAAYAAAVNEGIGGGVRVVRPYARLSKAEVLRRGARLPLEWTLSCLRPQGGRHCGACNKCAERRRGFSEAGLADPTLYREETPCSA
jgi:7-cyano-7-deazaguanine synthase